jgi:LCP family protein required for cell wall assembly
MPPVTSPLTRIRFRRAVTLMLMTLVIPGSAQLVAGRKEIGRIAIRIWLSLIITVVFVMLIGLVAHSFVFWLLTNGFMLGLVRFALMGMAVGWAYLFVDAWRLGDPLALHRQQRLAMVGINGVLCFSVVGSLLFVSHVVGVQKDFIATMFGSTKVTSAHDGRYNVLLLGGDSGSDRWGLRPDSLTVASIDEDTGKTILFGLPRNMTNFPFAKGSIMHEQFPDGYNCGANCELNSLATWAADHKPLFKGVANPGVEATQEAVEGITGLKINYYAMINLQGFRNLVTAVGGLTLNVREPIPIGRIGDITGYVKPGIRKLNGFETLWYARSRAAADDYSRMARQKCVMNAMLQQLSPQTVILHFEKIAKATTGLISTNLPASELDHFAELALKARGQAVRTVSFVPPTINTGHPAIGKIQRMVTSALTDTVATKGTSTKKTEGFTRGTATTTGASKGNIHTGYNANESSDLTDAC